MSGNLFSPLWPARNLLNLFLLLLLLYFFTETLLSSTQQSTSFWAPSKLPHFPSSISFSTFHILQQQNDQKTKLPLVLILVIVLVTGQSFFVKLMKNRRVFVLVANRVAASRHDVSPFFQLFSKFHLMSLNGNSNRNFLVTIIIFFFS